MGGKILPDGSTDAVSKAELLTALRAGRDGIWKQELTENGGYPVLVWQKAQATAGETVLAQDAAFEREIIETFADEPITLPTAKLNWKPVTGASGYAISCGRRCVSENADAAGAAGPDSGAGRQKWTAGRCVFCSWIRTRSSRSFQTARSRNCLRCKRKWTGSSRR